MPRVNLKDAAARLGVHYQTAYRWVRLGHLPAVKVGGSYEVDVADIERLAGRRAEPGPPRSTRRVRNWLPFANRTYRYLVAGDEVQVRDLLDQLTQDGVALVDLCDHVLVPALIWIGQAWMDGELSIAQEHRASSICERVLGRLAPAPPGRPRGVAVVCSPFSEEHHLPGVMATVALREDHWQVHHLGGGVPPAEVGHLAANEGAQLVVISLTWPPAQREAEALARALRAQGLRVLVGRPGCSLAALVAEARDGQG